MPIKLSIVGKKFRPQPRRVPSSISRNAITQNSGAITRSMFFPTSVTSLMVASLRAAQEDPEYLAAMEAAGYEVNYMDGEEYEQYMKDQEAVIIKWADELGYNG